MNMQDIKCVTDTGDNLSSLDLLECSVCLESILIKQPRLLTCGHSFCTQCLKNLATDGTITCPKCRAKTTVPDTGVETLPKNHDLTAMKDIAVNLFCSSTHATDNLCRTCLRRDKKVKATHACNKCPKYMICKSCADTHRRVPALKTHKVTPIFSKSCNSPTLCKKHNQSLEYFCEVCQLGLCLDCIYDNEHAKHENRITDIETGIRMIRSGMNNIQKELEAQLKSLERNICNLRKNGNELFRASVKMDQFRSELVQHLEQLDKCRDKLISHLNQTKESYSSSNKHMEDLQETQKIWKYSLRSGDTEFLATFKQHKNILEDLLKEAKEPVGAVSTATVTEIVNEVDETLSKTSTALRNLGSDKEDQQFGDNSGYLVQLETHTQAIRAVTELNGKILGNRQKKHVYLLQQPPSTINANFMKLESKPKFLNYSSSFETNSSQHNPFIEPVSETSTVARKETLTAAYLASFPPQEQKQILGERLYQVIEKMNPNQAGKITGMLLEMHNRSLLQLLHSREFLEAKIKEAINVLQLHREAIFEK